MKEIYHGGCLRYVEQLGIGSGSNEIYDMAASCGMKYEGTLRACDTNNQGIYDASYYGLLKEERDGAN